MPDGRDRFCGSNFDAFGNPRFTDARALKSATWSYDRNWGLTSFDNFPDAVLAMCQIITLEGWSHLMYTVQHTVGAFSTALIFVLLIIIGAFFMLNLMLAVLWDNYDRTHYKQEHEAAKKKIVEMKIAAQLKKRMRKAKLAADTASRAAAMMGKIATSSGASGAVEAEGEDDGGASAQIVELPVSAGDGRHARGQANARRWSSGGAASSAGAAAATMTDTGDGARGGGLTTALHLDVKKSPVYVAALELHRVFVAWWMRPLGRVWSNFLPIRALHLCVSHPVFEGAIFVLILGNAVTMALDTYPEVPETTAVIENVNFTFSCIFVIEMLLKGTGLGLRQYLRDPFNVFDVAIVGLFCVEVVLSPPLFIVTYVLQPLGASRPSAVVVAVPRAGACPPVLDRLVLLCRRRILTVADTHAARRKRRPILFPHPSPVHRTPLHWLQASAQSCPRVAEYLSCECSASCDSLSSSARGRACSASSETSTRPFAKASGSSSCLFSLCLSRPSSGCSSSRIAWHSIPKREKLYRLTRQSTALRTGRGGTSTRCTTRSRRSCSSSRLRTGTVCTTTRGAPRGRLRLSTSCSVRWHVVTRCALSASSCVHRSAVLARLSPSPYSPLAHSLSVRASLLQVVSIGVFVILNLFIAILISNFASREGDVVIKAFGEEQVTLAAYSKFPALAKMRKWIYAVTTHFKTTKGKVVEGADPIEDLRDVMDPATLAQLAAARVRLCDSGVLALAETRTEKHARKAAGVRRVRHISVVEREAALAVTGTSAWGGNVDRSQSASPERAEGGEGSREAERSASHSPRVELAPADGAERNEYGAESPSPVDVGTSFVNAEARAAMKAARDGRRSSLLGRASGDADGAADAAPSPNPPANVRRKTIHGGDYVDEDVNSDSKTTLVALHTLQESFAIFDQDSSGVISESELKVAMEKITGQTLTAEEVNSVMLKVDANSDGEIDFSEFIQMMALNGVVVDQRFEQCPKALVCDACGVRARRGCISRLRRADTACRDHAQYSTPHMQKRSLFLLPGTSRLRRVLFSFLENKALAPLTFDNFILVIIVVSTLCLALENPLLRPDHPLWSVLLALDIGLNALFTLEVVLKVLVMGFVCHRGAYIRNAWNMLDFGIVIIGWFSIGVTVFDLESVPGLKSLRTLRILRVLRPLRMIKRNPGMQLVVNAMFRSLADVFYATLLAFFFFTIFAIVATMYLKGALRACTGAVFAGFTPAQVAFITHPAPYDAMHAAWANSTEAVRADGVPSPEWGAMVNTTYSASVGAGGVVTSKVVCEWMGARWQQVVPQTFDNVLYSLMTLFEMVYNEGWVAIMYAAVDSRGAEMQPVRDASPWFLGFFLIFNFFGAFLIVNIFVGVIFTSYDELRKESPSAGGGLFMLSPSQRKWAAQRMQELKKDVKKAAEAKAKKIFAQRERRRVRDKQKGVSAEKNHGDEKRDSTSPKTPRTSARSAKAWRSTTTRSTRRLRAATRRRSGAWNRRARTARRPRQRQRRAQMAACRPTLRIPLRCRRSSVP